MATLLQRQAKRLDIPQAPIPATNRPGNLLRHQQVIGREVDVVSDQQRAGSDGDGPSRRVEAGRAKIGAPRGIALDGRPQSLELSPSHIGQIGPIGPRRRFLIQIDGKVQLAGNQLSGLLGQGDTFGHRHAPQRNEWEDIERADPRMGSLVAGQIDRRDRYLRRSSRRLDDRARLTGIGDNGPVMVCVHPVVEHDDPGNGRNRRDDPPHLLRVPPLTEIGHTFDDPVHLPSLPSMQSGSSSAFPAKGISFPPTPEASPAQRKSRKKRIPSGRRLSPEMPRSSTTAYLCLSTGIQYTPIWAFSSNLPAQKRQAICRRHPPGEGTGGVPGRTKGECASGADRSRKVQTEASGSSGTAASAAPLPRMEAPPALGADDARDHCAKVNVPHPK